jgi:hypothetical protein
MVGSALANTDWSTEPRNTGSIMLIAMSRFSRWLRASGSAGCTGAADEANCASAASAAIASPGPAALPLRESFINDQTLRLAAFPGSTR